MFSEEEFNLYGEMFKDLISDKEEQITILNFFYGLGTLIYSTIKN